MGWLTTPERIRQPARIRLVFLGISVLAFVITEFGRFVYRPWVRENGIEDFGLADCIGNLGGILVMIFLCLAFFNPTKVQSYRLAGFYSAGFVLYEFAQPYLPKGVFDWLDVYATILGWGISVVVLWTIWRLKDKTPRP